jgi:AcrR family transcriptional regulator
MAKAAVQRPSSPRRRDATATRAAILASARTAFARAGYDGVGVREIAAGAGVTAMLVNRYFGSKEKLFAEVLAAATANPTILSRENLASSNLGEAFATALVDITRTGETPLEAFQIMFNSASSKRAAAIGRRQIEKGHHRLLTGALKGKHAPERAAILLAIVAGVQVMRQKIGLSALADVKPADLVKLLTPILQRLIDGDDST